jgi:hypothetical protein
MGLREAAEAAWQERRETTTVDARARLGAVLTPFDVSTLDVAAVRVENDYRLVVFTDRDVHVAVREPAGDVHVVHADGDRWVIDAPVTSLPGLHEVLPPLPVPPEPGVPLWEPGVAVAVGEEYLYNGTVYVVVQAHTTQADWTPDKTPALWAVA